MDHDIGTRRGPVLRATYPEETHHSNKRIDSLSTSASTQSLISAASSPVFIESPIMSEYIYYSGYIKGVGSDITVVAFGQRYTLHKLILSRSSYFAALFSHAWQNQEDDKTVELEFNHDANIRRDTFELVIQRLYGRDDIVHLVDDSTPEETVRYAYLINRGILATATFLDMPELAHLALDCLIKGLSKYTVASLLKFATDSNYGLASKLITKACRAFLFTDGYKMTPAELTGIPSEVLADVITANEFYVPDEWLRCQFLIKIYKYRKANEPAEATKSIRRSRDSINHVSSSIESPMSALSISGESSLRNALNNGIHYCHLTFPQLQDLRTLMDVDGSPLIDTTVLTEAVWLQMNLRYQVTNDKPAISTPPPLPGLKRYPIPKPDPNSPGGVLRTIRGINDDEEEEEEEDDEDGNNRVKRNYETDYSWTDVPPFRFSVKFDNIVSLEEDARIYSRQVWYGGSFWRVYIQKCRHGKRHKLGIYLHRCDIDGVSPSSERNEISENIDRTENNRGEGQVRGDNSVYHSTFNYKNDEGVHMEDYNDEEEWDTTTTRVYMDGSNGWGRSTNTTRSSIASTNSTSSTISNCEYTDPRPMISTYFEIYTPSKRGRSSLTCFSSAPDTFKRAQSWGWKSSSLYALAEECERHHDVMRSTRTTTGDDTPGLQVTVVIGTV